ncbi:MAG TPA: ACT domain-containing protein [Gammaproteobacteria bacterium]|nr:ACT domain-containing protein [Gammaproteobacteria bacterium]
MKLILKLLEERFAVCRLDATAIVPAALLIPGHEFVSITRTPDELSLVCPESLAPAGAKVQSGWRAFKVQGPLDFSLTGVIASLVQPLAEAKISVFTIATYDTDYILVQEPDLAAAQRQLAAFLRL